MKKKKNTAHTCWTRKAVGIFTPALLGTHLSGLSSRLNKIKYNITFSYFTSMHCTGIELNLFSVCKKKEKKHRPPFLKNRKPQSLKLI